MRILDVIEIVQKLNEYINQHGGGASLFLLEVKTDGEDCVVEFMGFNIWHKNEDMRWLVEGTEEYEPLETYLKRECNQILPMQRFNDTNLMVKNGQ
jgi:hypothetical protein